MSTEIETKTERLRELLEREGLAGVLLNSQHNFAWISGGSYNGVDSSRENGVASILVTREGKRYLLTNKIEMPRMLAEEVSPDAFEPVEFPWQDAPIIEKSREIAGGRIATDIVIDGATPAIDWKIAPCRHELTLEEIDRFRELGKDAGIAMRTIFDKLSIGEAEVQIAAKVRRELAAFKIDSIVTLIAADERIEQFRHPVPKDNKWKKTLMLVICARRRGLVASLTRIACVGDITSELRDKTDAAAFVYASLLNATKKGATAKDLYEVALRAYAEAGFPDEINKHHQGGVAGYKPREWIAHPAGGETVKTNQAFAWNPSITGTKVEETVILGQSGIETITTSPDFPAISTTVGGVEFLSPGILGIVDGES